VYYETGVPCLQYICENHFQRLSKMSMFTGLKAVNHFGRPDMSSFLKFVQKKHGYVSNCGSVASKVSCADVNSLCPARNVMVVEPTLFQSEIFAVVFHCLVLYIGYHVGWFPCHHGMVHLQVVNGGDGGYWLVY
jgi:hypothetical protein